MAAESSGNAIREALEPFLPHDDVFGWRPDDFVVYGSGGMNITAGDLRRARTAYDAIGSGVKDLEWRDAGAGNHSSAHSELGLYVVSQTRSGNFRVFVLWIDPGGNDADREICEAGSLLEAKAAAQADFERRVLSYLSTHTAAGAGPVGEAVAAIRAEIDNALGCFEAAGAEGLMDVLHDGQEHDVGSLHDLVERRLMRVVEHLHSAVLGLAHLEADVRTVEEPGEVERRIVEITEPKGDEHGVWCGSPLEAVIAVQNERDELRVALAETRERLEKEAPVWRPIEERDRIIETIQTFGDVTLRNSHPVWVRDADGRVYEAVWTVDGKGRGYWWDTEGESPVDPIEVLPHPLTELAALSTQESSAALARDGKEMGR